MNSFNITDILFKAAAKKPIRICSDSLFVNKKCPTGIGYSKARPASVKSGVTCNAAALVLDRLLVDKDIACLEVVDAATAGESVFCEFENSDKKRLFCFFTKSDDAADALKMSEAFITDDVPTGADLLIGPVVYALSNASSYPASDELREIFDRIVESYKTNGCAELKDVAQFCDCFYYGFATNSDFEEIEVMPGDFAPEMVYTCYEKGYIEQPTFLNEVEDMPFPVTLTEKGFGPRAKNKGKKAKATAVSAIFQECLDGNRAIPFEWDDDQKLKIPELEYLNDYIPSNHFYSMLNKIEARSAKVLERLDSGLEGIDAIKKDFINSFVIGKPGTGKTTMAYALGAALRMPVYTVAITKNTEEDTFQGMTKVVDGQFQFVSTDFLEAYTHGGIIILEEINLADPSVIMGALGQAVEAPFVLMQDGYKAVRRHPLCVIIGTMNIGTYGAKGVSQAFSSRFKQTYILDDPKKEDFIAILRKQGHPETKCKWVYDAYTKINNYLKSPEISREEICLNVTLRGCLGALECMDEGDAPRQAIENSLVGKVAEVDLDLAQQINNNIVKTLTDLKA